MAKQVHCITFNNETFMFFSRAMWEMEIAELTEMNLPFGAWIHTIKDEEEYEKILSGSYIPEEPTVKLNLEEV